MLILLQHNPITSFRTKDPTRTITLRNRFSSDASVRLHRLRKAIRVGVITKDFFGLKGQHLFNPQSTIVYLAKKKFIYTHTDQKIKGFMDWLKDQYTRGLLEVTPSLSMTGSIQNQPWSNLYIRSAYQSGLAQSRKDAIARGIKVPAFTIGGPGSLSGVFNQPFHADRAAMMYTRVFSDLNNVTKFMDAGITRVMTQGMAEGIGPYEMARRMNDIVEQTTKKPFPPAHPKGPSGITRARLIARTETIRTHNVAAINEMERMEVEVGKPILAEWVATLDGRTRDSHAERNGNVYDRSVAIGMLGEPNCRCSIIPFVKGLHKVGKGKKIHYKTPVERFTKKQKAAHKVKQDLMRAAYDFRGCLLGYTGNYTFNIPPFAQSCTDYKLSSDGKSWLFKERPVVDEEILKRIKKMAIPPSWKNVVVARDPLAKMQAIGQAKSGKWQYKFSNEHIKGAAKRKFDRCKLFTRDMPGMLKKMEDGILAGEDIAHLLRLEWKTAIRNGKRGKKVGEHQVYGLTTIKQRHISVVGDKITLRFYAKEHIRQKYVLHDDVLAAWLKKKRLGLDRDDLLFPKLTPHKLNNYVSKIADGKKYTIKDFRTYHGTRIAREELERINKKLAGKALTDAERKKIIKEVSEKVSNFLHNTPGMAKSSYIDPTVWNIIGGDVKKIIRKKK